MTRLQNQRYWLLTQQILAWFIEVKRTETKSQISASDVENNKLLHSR